MRPMWQSELYHLAADGPEKNLRARDATGTPFIPELHHARAQAQYREPSSRINIA